MFRRINDNLFQFCFNLRFLMFRTDRSTKRMYFKLLLGRLWSKGEGSIEFKGIQIYYPDYHDFFYMWTEIFVRHVYRIELDTQEPMIVDGGGNIGLATIYYKIQYPKSTIHVFEPIPKNREFLNKNVSKLENVEVHATALADYDGETVIYTKRGDTIGGGSSLLPDKSNEMEETVVKVSRLSTFVKSWGQIDIMKLDVEGSETSIIRDLDEQNLVKSFRWIVGEYHFLADWKENAIGDFAGILQKHGMYTRLFVGDEPPVNQVVNKNAKYHTHFVVANPAITSN